MDLDRLLEPLQTPQEKIYVHARLRGMSEKAAYLAAGGKGNPNADTFQAKPHVLEVLRACMNVSAQETGMTRDKIKDMLLDAHANATTALEQVAAIRELAKLFGLYAPTTVKVDHKHSHQHAIEDKRKRINELPMRELEDLLAIDGEFHEVVPQLRIGAPG